MFKIMKYLRGAGWTVLLIVVLLIVQASCELALPQYTSRIVDVGIQQGGIDSAAPTQLRTQTMDTLRMLMTAEEQATVAAAYTLEDGVYTRDKLDQATLDAVSDAFTMPMVMLSMADEAGMLSETTIGESVGGSQTTADGRVAVSGGLNEDQLLAAREAAMASLDEMTASSLMTQRAVLFVRGEYEAMGMDLGRLQTNYLLLTGAKMLGVTLVMVAAAVLVGLLAARTGAALGRDLRRRVFGRVVAFSTGDMERFSTASLITRSTNDIQQVQMVAVMLLRMVIYSPILGIGGVIKVAGTRTGLSWIILVAVAAVMVLVGFLMVVAMPRFRKMQSLVDRINLVAREILTGLPVIRAFSREQFEEERFDGANTDLMQTQLFTNRVMTFMMPTMMLIMNAVTLAIVWFGAQGVDMGRLQVGDMMAFITYTMQIVMSFLMLTMISVMLPRATVAAGRIDEVLQTEPSITDGGDTDANARTHWRGEVTFDQVSFRYPDAEADVLHDITFTAPPGKTTAIIGATGSGKSTVLNLIPRFFDVTAGTVKLDGVDIRDLSQHTLRAQLGYVPQKGVLFSGDIESNIKFGGDDITDAEMIDAAKIAQADTFIEEKPEKYHDPIAQGGTNVSGGQKQRLSIARAIAKQPKVLLFDDSFSALDYKTDVALRRALAENVKDATVLIVAQRISTILYADQILVMDEGSLVGVGTHEELMDSCPAYQEIARSQLSESELMGGKGA